MVRTTRSSAAKANSKTSPRKNNDEEVGKVHLESDEEDTSSSKDSEPLTSSKALLRKRNEKKSSTGTKHFPSDEAKTRSYRKSSSLTFCISLIFTLFACFLYVFQENLIDLLVSQSRVPFQRPKRLELVNTILPYETKLALGGFHDELSTRPIFPTHGRVLQIETNPKKFEQVKSIVLQSFPTEEFSLVIMDPSRSNKALSSDFFVEHPQDRPLVVIVLNSHKASDEYMRTFAHGMSEKYLVHESKTRWSNNVGFLFLGSSLPLDSSCETIDLYDHNEKSLRWTHTILTRLTTTTKVC